MDTARKKFLSNKNHSQIYNSITKTIYNKYNINIHDEFKNELYEMMEFIFKSNPPTINKFTMNDYIIYLNKLTIKEFLPFLTSIINDEIKKDKPKNNPLFMESIGKNESINNEYDKLTNSRMKENEPPQQIIQFTEPAQSLPDKIKTYEEIQQERLLENNKLNISKNINPNLTTSFSNKEYIISFDSDDRSGRWSNSSEYCIENFRFENIVEVELLQCIVTNNSTIKNNMYILLEINEFGSIYTSTNEHVNKSFAKFYIYDSNSKYIELVNIQYFKKDFSKNPININNISIRFRDKNGDLLDKSNDFQNSITLKLRLS